MNTNARSRSRSRMSQDTIQSLIQTIENISNRNKRKMEKVVPKPSILSTKTNGSIMSVLRAQTKKFSRMVNVSEATHSRNDKSFDPDRAKAHRQKRFSTAPGTENISEVAIRKAQIREGKVYGTTSKRTGSGYNPSKAKVLRAEIKKNEEIFQSGLGKSAVIYSGRSEDLAGAPYNPAKARNARRKRKMDEDD